ncbi:hypothetical protein [Streptomyces sp. NPDC059788]|uniref:hypothetical protein n=1 Tax=Streptomyces sp. NPDC059788 TaxID=3346948 RepID=UPI003648F37C
MNRSVRNLSAIGTRTTARRRLRLLAVSVAVLLAAGAVGPALAAPPPDAAHPAGRATAAQSAAARPQEDPWLNGSAKLRRADGDDVRFSFDARFRKDETPGFSVHDRARTDRLGYSWAATPGPASTKELPRCASSAPFETVESGDFTVVPWDRPVS